MDNIIIVKIGLLFGSFNPVHVGHLIVADQMRDEAGLDQVWLVVSPQSPFKSTSELADDTHRLKMVKLALKKNKCLKACGIELGLPKPSYTIHTLEALRSEFPGNEFALIMGQDNLAGLDRWKSIEVILAEYEILVYKRKGSKRPAYLHHPHIRVFNLPTIDISATFIRDKLRRAKSVQYLVPDRVLKYLKKHSLYITGSND